MGFGQAGGFEGFGKGFYAHAGHGGVGGLVAVYAHPLLHYGLLFAPGVVGGVPEVVDVWQGFLGFSHSPVWAPIVQFKEK